MNNNQQLQPIIAIIDNESFKSDYLYGNSLTELKEKLLEKNITLYSFKRRGSSKYHKWYRKRNEKKSHCNFKKQ